MVARKERNVLLQLVQGLTRRLVRAFQLYDHQIPGIVSREYVDRAVRAVLILDTVLFLNEGEPRLHQVEMSGEVSAECALFQRNR